MSTKYILFVSLLFSDCFLVDFISADGVTCAEEHSEELSKCVDMAPELQTFSKTLFYPLNNTDTIFMRTNKAHQCFLKTFEKCTSPVPKEIITSLCSGKKIQI